MGRLWYIDSDGKRKRTPEGTKHDYKKYQSSRKAKKDRAERNRLRRQALREGRVTKGDKTREIDHIRGLAEGGDSRPSNLRIVSSSFNRGRKQSSRRRGSRRRKESWGV